MKWTEAAVPPPSADATPGRIGIREGKGDRTVDHKTILRMGLAAVAFGVILGVGAGWLRGKWIPVGLAAAITLILI